MPDRPATPRVGEIAPPASKLAQVPAWLMRALTIGFGDPTAYQKFKHPGADVQVPPETPQGIARAALLGQMGGSK